MKKIVQSLLIFCLSVSCLFAQKTAPARDRNIVFSAIKGTVSKPDSFMVPGTSRRIVNSDTTAFRILFFEKGWLKLVFAPAANFTGIARATIRLMDHSGKIIEHLQLTGLSTRGLEGENEAPLSMIVEALGYKTNIGWAGLANHSRPELQGDELPFSLFQKAKKGIVEMIPVARYSPDFELPFGYYTEAAEQPEKHELGVLAKAGIYPEHQGLFPAMASGNSSFDPGNRVFGLYATGPTHTAYSEDVWNMLFYPGNAVRATRIYPLKDVSGKRIPNTYLLCFEEAKNGDYNDYVFLLKNAVPVTISPFTSLFNGKDLKGWHTFLRDFGKNEDPDHNFSIEDSSIHVIGKNLGYAITDSGYNNYHFKVDFKWGVRKWPPREKGKRDGGACYNIPMDEPDSIWPRSIECQIQEGDVGDFWLLGFSTIKVNGVQNIPANHSRVIKLKDAERPYGEWNTVEVISYNGKCVQVVNGVVVNVGEEASVKNGRILLQSEYAEIFYRNVRIRKL